MSDEQTTDGGTGKLGRVRFESCALFQGLPAAVLEEIGRVVVEREYAADTTIFVEGDPAVDVCVLASGEVELDYTLPNPFPCEFF